MTTTDTGKIPFYGMYQGICVNNVDPEGLNRITATVPQVFGNDTTATDWAWPCFPPGWGMFATAVLIPATGAGVYISFIGGDIDDPIWLGVWQGDS